MENNIAFFIEHSFLKPTTTIADIELVCSQARLYGFAAVCVPPLFVKKAKEYTADSPVKVATVIGFPFGYSAVEAKLSETVLAIIDGADELDMVINIAALKNNDWQYLAHELNSILPIIKAKGKTFKIIIESGMLTDEEMIKCCDLYGLAGVDFLQTSTGFAQDGVTIAAVKLIRKHLADAVHIKASGTINNYTFARELIDAGATRLGCSNSLQLLKYIKP
ncbi:MAG: deoxyribose-phosphate aldolase [Ferruginibacter sp.]